MRVEDCRRAFGYRTFSASTSTSSNLTGGCRRSTSITPGNCSGPVAWNVASSWASFERPNGQFTGIQQINGDRLNIEPRVRLPFDWTPGFLHFTGGYRYTQYNLDDVPIGTSEEPDRKIWMGSVDSGLFFERESKLFGGWNPDVGAAPVLPLPAVPQSERSAGSSTSATCRSRSTSCFATTASQASTASATRTS